VELFTGGTWQTDGITGGLMGTQGQFSDHFEMARYSQEFGKNSVLESYVSRNDFATEANPTVNGTDNTREVQYDAEILHRLHYFNDRLYTTYGGSYRGASAESGQLFPGQTFSIMMCGADSFNNRQKWPVS